MELNTEFGGSLEVGKHGIHLRRAEGKVHIEAGHL
jgi:hypothetical protein